MGDSNSYRNENSLIAYGGGILSYLSANLAKKIMQDHPYSVDIDADIFELNKDLNLKISIEKTIKRRFLNCADEMLFLSDKFDINILKQKIKKDKFGFSIWKKGLPSNFIVDKQSKRESELFHYFWLEAAECISDIFNLYMDRNKMINEAMWCTIEDSEKIFERYYFGIMFYKYAVVMEGRLIIFASGSSD